MNYLIILNKKAYTNNLLKNINNCFTLGFINHTFVNGKMLVKVRLTSFNSDHFSLFEINKNSSVKNVKNKIIIGIPPYDKYVKIALIADTTIILNYVEVTNFLKLRLPNGLRYEFSK